MNQVELRRGGSFVRGLVDGTSVAFAANAMPRSGRVHRMQRSRGVSAFEHIVVATEFGSSSFRAVQLATELATRLHARLTVLHVAPAGRPVYPVDEPLAFRQPIHEGRERDAKRALDALLGAFASSGPRYEGVVRIGEPAREIVAYAEESACDLIVVGTHGRGAPSRWVLGSVAERVVRASRVPVLTVRTEAARGVRRWQESGSPSG
jgi:nucleotide-binding universal stress UspA family protein